MLNDFDNSQDREATYDYLDFLASVLTEHEKNLDEFIKRLKKAVDVLEKEIMVKVSEDTFDTDRETQQKTGVEKRPKTIAYVKLIKY